MSIIDFILGWAGSIHRSLKWKQTKHSLRDFLLHQFLGFWCEKNVHSLYYNTCIWLIQFKHSKRKTENSSFQWKSHIYQGWKIPFSNIGFFQYLDLAFSKIWWCFFHIRQEVEILPLHISHSRDQLCKSLTREYISTCFNKYLLNTKMVSENKTNWKFFFQFNFKILCWQ